MKTVLAFDYSIGQAVRLKDLGVSAVVTSLMRDSGGSQYQVTYWDNGSRKVEWVLPFEIAEIL